MTKAEIVNEIAKKTGIEKSVVLTTVESFMDVVKTSLTNQEPVYLRGFGSFIIKHRAEKTARDIHKEKTIFSQGEDNHYPRAQHSGLQACKDIHERSKKIRVINL